MAVARKPVQSQPKSVDEFINAGAAPPPATVSPTKTEVVPVKLRIEPQLLADIDAAVDNRKPSPSRHQWILEAIYEKLERESFRPDNKISG